MHSRTLEILVQRKKRGTEAKRSRAQQTGLQRGDRRTRVDIFYLIFRLVFGSRYKFLSPFSRDFRTVVVRFDRIRSLCFFFFASLFPPFALSFSVPSTEWYALVFPYTKYFLFCFSFLRFSFVPSFRFSLFLRTRGLFSSLLFTQ